MNLVNTQTIHKVAINQEQKINCVRIYLRVKYVSEIYTINGDSFAPGILEGEEYQLNYKTTLTKPHQENPGKHSCLL